jgi:hypothetical protein
VFGQPTAANIDLSDLAVPQWGSHWIYRGAAEICAAAAGIFIAAGIARGREALAAIVGGCAISLGFITKLGLFFFLWMHLGPEEYSITEPWYQYAIDGVMIFVPPIVGLSVAETAEKLNQDEPNGFGGINRWHFVWLWLPAFWYARGLIAPFVQFYTAQFEVSIIKTVLAVLVHAIPAAAIAVPGYYGMTLLAGHHGNTMHPAGRNLVGALVLVFGFFVGTAVQFGWYYLMGKIGTAIFG